MQRAPRKYLLDGGEKDWDDLLPNVAMDYRKTKRKAVGFSPSFLILRRDPIFQFRLQHLEEEELDPPATTFRLQVFLY